MANIIVIVILLVVVGLAIRSIWKKRKSGCSCGCSGCPSAGNCGKRQSERGKDE